MSKKFYVYSTLSADVRYQNTVPGGADLPQVVADVFIKGGAGVANDRFITPRGVVTEVTEEQVEQLRANNVFQLHEKNGYVEISEAKTDPDAAAADMTARDVSAPLVPEDLPADGRPTSDTPDEDAEQEAPRPTSKKRK